MIENKRKLAVYYWNKTEADGADLGTEISTKKTGLLRCLSVLQPTTWGKP